MLTKSITQKILFGVFFFSVLISLLLCDVKFRSLGFHNIDYAFYMEFAAKLPNVNDADTYSINPEGENWLFMAGVDGTDHLQQSVHFEPIKYIYAVLYKIFKSPYALFTFIALVFFIPLPYLAFAAPMDTESGMWSALSLGLLYLAFPSVYFVPAFDLRPYIFLGPFFFLAVLSIRLSRPTWEKLLWFNAMFLAREEAIILGAVVLLYSLARTFPRSMKLSDLVILFASYGIWIAGTLAYLRWTGYPVAMKRLPSFILGMYERLSSPSPLLMLAVTAGSIVGIAILWLAWRNLGERCLFWDGIQVLSIGTVFLPLGYQLINDNERGNLDLYLFSPRYFLHYIAVILFIVAAAGCFKIRFQRGARLGFVALCVAMVILVNTLAPKGFLNEYRRFDRAAQFAQVIWSFKEDLDPKNSSLLVDYATHQAFFDFEHVYAYNRLPWSLASGKRRYYPGNQGFLYSLVSEQTDYVIISRTSLDDINSLFTATSVQGQVTFENEQFIGLGISR